ncbi:FAD-dependent oxidoreductase [Sulfurisphaera javensis]|uniref:FAD-dependent oxidoreductase n=1 Tax=Sulfurisphaera javensis TaxID=2049879 RepID=A0AAT9GRQ8_9CREN
MQQEFVNNEIYDVVIVGAGIAGLSAALYASRQRMKTLVVAKDLGGQLTLTDLIENYPAVDSIGGLGLIRKVENQAKRFGAKFVYGEEINEIHKEGDLFKLKGILGEYIARTVILAFGKTPRELNVPGEKELKGRGVSYCAICDAAFFKDKPAVVVGEGEPGVEAIELLSRYAKPAYYVSLSQQLVSEDEATIKSLLSNPNIKMFLGYRVTKIIGNSKVEGVVIQNIKTKEEITLNVDGIIIEMGYILRTDFLRDLVKLNEKGEIIVDELGRTSMEGIFAAGDVTNTPYKQAVVAAAEGVKAALSAFNYLRSKSGLPPVSVDWKAEKKKAVVSFRL